MRRLLKEMRRLLKEVMSLPGSPYWSSRYDPEYVWVVEREAPHHTIDIFGTEDAAMQWAEAIYGNTTVTRKKVEKHVPEWVDEIKTQRKQEERVNG